MSRPHKAVAFAGVIGLVVALVLSLSLYKVAVANAFVRLAPPADEAAAAQAFAAQRSRSPAARARGAHLVALVGCADCHGSELSGRTLVARPGELTLVAPNLTPAGPTAQFDATRWRAALRWGVDGEGRVLWGMPRHALLRLADDDVAALVAHLEALPPITHELPHSQLGWRGYVQVALRRLRLVVRAPLPRRAAEAAVANAPAAGTSAFGPYLAGIGRCTQCHGPAAADELNAVARPTAPALGPTARALDAVTWRERLRQGRCRGPDVAPDAPRDPAPRGGGQGTRARLQDLSAEEAEALRRAWL